VVIEGKAGVGKTRLAEDFLRFAATDGATVLRGRGYDARSGTPFGPVVEVLREALDAPGVATIDAEWLSEVGRLVPEVRRRFPAVPEPGAPARATERWRLHEGVAQVVLAVAEERPTVLFVDDLQWCDADSCAMLHFLVRRLEKSAALVIAALALDELERDAPAARPSRALRSRARATVLPLPALTEEQVWQMIREMGFIKGAAGARRFASRVFGVTDGNPFHVVELLKTLFAQGLLAVDGVSGEWMAAAARYAFEEALSWLDLASGAGASRDEAEEVDRRTAEVLHLAGWSEPPHPVQRPGTPARGFDRSDLDLRECAGRAGAWRRRSWLPPVPLTVSATSLRSRLGRRPAPPDHEDRPAVEDAGIADLGESGALGEAHTLIERRLPHVAPRLHQHQPSPGLEGDPDLPKHGALIRHFVQHPERQGEVEGAVELEAGGIHPLQSDPRRQPRPLGAPSDACQHLGLHVRGRHAPRWTDESRHGDREVADPAPEVQARVSRADDVLEDLLRPLQQTPQRVVERAYQPPRTDALCRRGGLRSGHEVESFPATTPIA
jgi:hypothetical protein